MLPAWKDKMAKNKRDQPSSEVTLGARLSQAKSRNNACKSNQGKEKGKVSDNQSYNSRKLFANRRMTVCLQT